MTIKFKYAKSSELRRLINLPCTKGIFCLLFSPPPPPFHISLSNFAFNSRDKTVGTRFSSVCCNARVECHTNSAWTSTSLFHFNLWPLDPWPATFSLFCQYSVQPYSQLRELIWLKTSSFLPRTSFPTDLPPELACYAVTRELLPVPGRSGEITAAHT